MYCLVILTWSLSTERKCVRARSRSRSCSLPYKRCSNAGFDCLRMAFLLLLLLSCLPCTFTSINKRFNAEVTCIPSESSLLQSHIFAGFCVLLVCFFSLFSLQLFICDMRLQFWLFLRCMHYLHISLLFHVLEIWTRAIDPTCAATQTHSIDKNIHKHIYCFYGFHFKCHAFYWSRHFQFFVPLFCCCSFFRTENRIGIDFVIRFKSNNDI